MASTKAFTTQLAALALALSLLTLPAMADPPPSPARQAELTHAAEDPRLFARNAERLAKSAGGSRTAALVDRLRHLARAGRGDQHQPPGTHLAGQAAGQPVQAGFRGTVDRHAAETADAVDRRHVGHTAAALPQHALQTGPRQLDGRLEVERQSAVEITRIAGCRSGFSNRQ